MAAKKIAPRGLLRWWAGLGFYSLDLLGVPEIYETAIDFGKWGARPLTHAEKEIARSVFGGSIPLDHVRVDESARIGCRHWGVVYVSFFTINAWGRFHPAILIHELVHVWQFQQFGSIYIPKALLAQRTGAGYDYGGAEALRRCLGRGGSLQDFNFEQQADIIADYFSIRQGWPPRWGGGTLADLPVYEPFVREIRGKI